MEAYLAEVRKIEKHFLGLELQHVPCGTNREADEIAKRASRRLPQEPGVFEERLFKPSAAPPAAESASPQERLPPTSLGSPCLRSNLRSMPAPGTQAPGGVLDQRVQGVPGARNTAREGGRRGARGPTGYGVLHSRRKQGCDLLADIHDGDCGHHSSSRTLVGKAFRSGFYWPMALSDAAELVRSCEACQFHAKKIQQPAQGLQTIPLSWPFAVWGLDILGPFP
ncbi:uncharacterized protein [Aegilops tauschii subsp. strangulata]|uniref:uncharacterized protein n=1 Tax=Aegilops tauschii subsp. strangulata TaxID=200361 RepID=UPI00098AD466|nr:uncharacterized protein LOC109766655 [Aegilops tauschii subsp. strangulata]